MMIFLNPKSIKRNILKRSSANNMNKYTQCLKVSMHVQGSGRKVLLKVNGLDDPILYTTRANLKDKTFPLNFEHCVSILISISV